MHIVLGTYIKLTYYIVKFYEIALTTFFISNALLHLFIIIMIMKELKLNLYFLINLMLKYISFTRIYMSLSLCHTYIPKCSKRDWQVVHKNVQFFRNLMPTRLFEKRMCVV